MGLAADVVCERVQRGFLNVLLFGFDGGVHTLAAVS
jgi:hypothetical protein